MLWTILFCFSNFVVPNTLELYVSVNPFTCNFFVFLEDCIHMYMYFKCPSMHTAHGELKQLLAD